MLINRKYQLWRVVAKPDYKRETVEHVKIFHRNELKSLNNSTGTNGFAIATNGNVLAIVPVQIEDDDYLGDGMFDPAILQEAAKVMPKTLEDVKIVLGERNATLFDETTRNRYRPGFTHGMFPNISPIIPKERPGVDTACLHPFAAFDVRLLNDLTMALGQSNNANGRNHIRLLFSSPRDGNVMVVEPIVAPIKRTLFAPVGLIMPLYSNNGYYHDYKPKERLEFDDLDNA